ncbi:hypothetical protein FGO68_gene6378 [Halteria grandinella]|uniref:Histidine kinase n=1 Tax=Halteria grandinella TaxID=5974 RepID=A0A8J8P0C4_HALGN|nr:hypothetical protein FGO68_gene6378 [Halteria grandinella]
MAYEKLKMQNHFLEMLTATVSHDMRTPLNAILGLGEQLQHFILHQDGLYLHKILMNSSRLLLSLVNDLLDLFRLKNGKFTNNREWSDFRGEIAAMVDLFGVQAEAKGVKLVFDCHTNVPGKLSIDLQRVKQVLINLIGNSLKFTYKGSIVVSAKIIQTDQTMRFLKVTVCDTGIGIKDEDKEKVFKMFGKLEASEKINTSGIGLGVSICKQIIEGLGGQLTLVDGCESLHCLQNLIYSDPSENCEGTTFSFSVKLIDEPFNFEEASVLDIISKKPQIRGSQHSHTSRSERSQCNYYPDNPSVSIAPHEQLQLILEQADIKLDLANIGKAVQGIISKNANTNNCETQNDDVLIQQFDVSQLLNVKEEVECPCSKRNKILVVDDNVFNILTLKYLLKECANLEADQALNGLQAVEQVQERAKLKLKEPCICGQESANYRLIFMDCNMPVMDGLSATQEIRKLAFADLQIVAITAYSTKGFEKKCYKAGMDEFETKPIFKDRLKDIVNRRVFQTY